MGPGAWDPWRTKFANVYPAALATPATPPEPAPPPSAAAGCSQSPSAMTRGTNPRAPRGYIADIQKDIYIYYI